MNWNWEIIGLKVAGLYTTISLPWAEYDCLWFDHWYSIRWVWNYGGWNWKTLEREKNWILYSCHAKYIPPLQCVLSVRGDSIECEPADEIVQREVSVRSHTQDGQRNQVRRGSDFIGCLSQQCWYEEQVKHNWTAFPQNGAGNGGSMELGIMVGVTNAESIGEYSITSHMKNKWNAIERCRDRLIAHTCCFELFVAWFIERCCW